MFKVEDYEDYYDIDDDDAAYKHESKFNRISRKLFARKTKETKEHVESAMDREMKRSVRKNEKESFFER